MCPYGYRLSKPKRDGNLLRFRFLTVPKFLHFPINCVKITKTAYFGGWHRGCSPKSRDEALVQLRLAIFHFLPSGYRACAYCRISCLVAYRKLSLQMSSHLKLIKTHHPPQQQRKRLHNLQKLIDDQTATAFERYLRSRRGARQRP